jgi:hypothetical protein
MRQIEKPDEDEYVPYVKRYIELLPDDGLILDHLEVNHQETRAFLLSLPEDKLLYRYAEGKWTIKEIVQHLSDDERIYAYRALRFARNDFPPQIKELYQQTMDALSASVLQGNAREDRSKGYALSINDQGLRAKQLAVRAYAFQHESLIRAVLDSSRDARQRIVAAYLLGYARQSRQQIAYLVRASHDADETVRNNATRALGVLGESSPSVAAQIPAGRFIDMLSSGSWTDRNKAGWVLSTLTKSRDPKLLAQLRSEALVSLIEMARWRNAGHAHNARILLARIAGVEEERANQLANAGKVEEIINALGLKP